MNDMLDTGLIEELRALKKLGSSPSVLLKYIIKKIPEDRHIVFTSMKYFRRAFDLSIKQTSPIGGWYSGELSDEAFDKFLNEEISANNITILKKHIEP